MTPTATTTYSLTVSNSDGCANTTVYTTTVTVNVAPSSPGATNSGPVCAGTGVTLFDHSTNATGWTWRGSDGSTNTSQSPVVTPTATTTYSLTMTNTDGCSNATVYTTTVTVNTTNTGTITGASSVNVGSNITLTDAVSGGTWSASNGNATVIGGVVNGVTAGAVTISYSVTGSCGTAAATKAITITTTGGGSVSPISGYFFYVCVGSTTAFWDATTGGTWSVSPASAGVASISATGVLTGISAGTATISYTKGSASATSVVNVYPVPAPITGIATVCQGATTTLSDVTPGGVWSSDIASTATINSSGVVTGSNAGTVPMYYTLVSPAGCRSTLVVTVNAAPSSINGTSVMCAGSTVTLTDATAGGTWSTLSTNISLTGGSVTGLSGGTATVTYNIGVCRATRNVTVNAAPAAISGSPVACIGATTTLSDATSGAVSWTSSNTSVATVTASGVVTGTGAGTATISYTITDGCRATTVVSVNAAVSAIAGNSRICPTSTELLTDATGGGLWTSSNTAVATVGSGSGLVLGVSGGTAIITYSVGGAGCKSVAIVTVTNAALITGLSSVCAGSTLQLSNATTGGAWTSSNPGVATVGSSTGIVTGVSASTATISYNIASGCSLTKTITVNPVPAAITGAATICLGSSATLSDASAGTWSSSAIYIASVGSSGVVTALVVGTATISFSAAGCAATMVVTVNNIPSSINGASSVCAGATIPLSDLVGGGVWSSTSPDGSVDASGHLTGISAGIAAVTYTLPSTGCAAMRSITVNSDPLPITGSLSVCAGSRTFLADASSTALSWSSSTTTAATVTATGVVTGLAAGTTTITYKLTTGCFITAPVTVNALPIVAAISGPATVSHGGPAILLSDVTGGGTWSSSHTAVATVGTDGTVTAAASSGTATISYTVTNAAGCMSAATKTITATAAPHAHGGTTTTVGATVRVADEAITGDWTSSDNSIATVDNAGIVTGIASGNVIITHAIANIDGDVSNITTQVTVMGLPLEANLLPNPNKGTFILKGTLGSTADAAITIKITNMLGQVVYSKTSLATGGVINEQVQLNNTIANGMYLLDLQSGSESKTFHFVIE